MNAIRNGTQIKFREHVDYSGRPRAVKNESHCLILYNFKWSELVWRDKGERDGVIVKKRANV